MDGWALKEPGMGPRAPVNKTTEELNGWPGTKELSSWVGPKVAHGSQRKGESSRLHGRKT
jgi:hypothetical protein